MYVYIYSKAAGCYTVGFYKPDGEWEPESDHPTDEAAAKRVAWLNGGDKVREVLVRPTGYIVHPCNHVEFFWDSDEEEPVRDGGAPAT